MGSVAGLVPAKQAIELGERLLALCGVRGSEESRRLTTVVGRGSSLSVLGLMCTCLEWRVSRGGGQGAITRRGDAVPCQDCQCCV